MSDALVHDSKTKKKRLDQFSDYQQTADKTNVVS